MKKSIFLILLLISTFGYSQSVKNVNPDKNGDPWIVGGYRELTAPEDALIPELTLPYQIQRSSLPGKCSNAGQPYFRGVVIQHHGSCSQTSGIAYVYTYEINLMRGLASKDSSHLYPSHYTYNFLNEGDGTKGSNYTDGWQIIKENGCPSFKEYGGLYPMEEKGWMSGYQNYYKGMVNRVSDYYKIKTGTPEGLETLKRWLYDHGNGSKVGGLAVFSAGAAAISVRRVALGQYAERKAIVVKFSDPVDHAMTFIGYDDSVGFDFNNDGKITNDLDITGDTVVDMRDWERGAMLMVNTWGFSWGDSGFVYVPYRLLALKVKEGGISSSQAYVVVPKPADPPQMTLKLLISHNKRSQLNIRVGIAEYINAEKHDYQISYTAFSNKGGAYPMQGVNEDPIEIALDISPLLAQTEFEPVVFFLNVTEEDNDSNGFGIIHGWSIIDHRNGDREYVASDTSLPIRDDALTSSKILILNTVYPPENLEAVQEAKLIRLQWDKPRNPIAPDFYQVYRDGKAFKSCTDTFMLIPSVANGTTFRVKACYDSILSPPSNTVMISNNLHMPVAGSGSSIQFDGNDDCINCGKSINLANHDFTIEFWAKRNPDAANRFVIGHGKWNTGSKGLHIGFRDNKFYVGFWGDDISSSQEYTDPEWHHYAISFDTVTKKQKIYRDGAFLKEREAEANYKGSGTLYIGCMSATNWIFEGQLDEIRIWNYVRSDEEIASHLYLPLKGDENGILGYWNFDERSGDSIIDISANNNTGHLNQFTELCWKNSLAWGFRKMAQITDSILVFPGYSKYGHDVLATISIPPASGKVTFDSASGNFIYTANSTFMDRDSFYYTVSDDTLISEYKIVIQSPFLSACPVIPEFPAIRIYPNPFNSRIFVELQSEVFTEGKIILTDMSGRILLQKDLYGQTKEEFHTEQLLPGFYILEIISPVGKRSYKLLKK